VSDGKGLQGGVHKLAEIIIREFSPAYQEDVISLILNIQRNEFDIPISKEDQPDLSDIPNFYQSGCGNFWVALDNNQVVGTIALIDIGNHQVALRKMFVEADYRGRRYNTAELLLVSCMSWASKHNIHEIYLGTTEKFLAAHRFYEKNRFVQIASELLPNTFPIMKVDTRFYKITLK
jgi:N-acetylglutamate synthase-like GNAT family acetyltransferase